MVQCVKTIQKLTGKLGQKLRDLKDDVDADLIKYVINSVIAAVNLDLLDEEDVEEDHNIARMRTKVIEIQRREFDPAQYNFGPNANTKTPWGEEHIGEVWWDLSTVKWLWYEQDTQEYKSNNWGKLFPGSSVDVYEWIESTLLPSEYAIASASASETLGISGTPLKLSLIHI